jgi:hypothetical protein
MAGHLTVDQAIVGSSPISHPSGGLLHMRGPTLAIQMTDTELHWLAGLLEGEGSFSPGPPSAKNSVRIMLTMTDEDVVARVAQLWGVAYHEVRRDRCEAHGWKPNFYVHLRGRPAVDLMQRMAPLMGLRRQQQIERALSSYDPNLRRKLSPEQLTEIRAKVAEGRTHTQLAEEYEVDRSTISHIKAGRRPTYR